MTSRFRMTVEQARAAILQLLEQNSLLNLEGYGIANFTRNIDKRRKSLADGREKMIDDWSLNQFINAVEWITARMLPIKSINIRHTSYGLKHLAEEEVGYMTNGIFIAAALHCGYRTDFDGLNPSFNFSEKAIQVADAIIKRNGRCPC